MIKLFLAISKYLVKSGKYVGSVSVLAVAAWGVFSWVDSRQDEQANMDKIIYEQVIPKLDLLIKADSASRARDVDILSRIDDLGEQVSDNTKSVVAVTTSYTNWVKKHAITIDEFTEFMEPWLNDVSTLKKKNSLEPGSLLDPSGFLRFPELIQPLKSEEVSMMVTNRK